MKTGRSCGDMGETRKNITENPETKQKGFLVSFINCCERHGKLEYEEVNVLVSVCCSGSL
jgi:hypothetical protein